MLERRLDGAFAFRIGRLGDKRGVLVRIGWWNRRRLMTHCWIRFVSAVGIDGGFLIAFLLKKFKKIVIEIKKF